MATQEFNVDDFMKWMEVFFARKWMAQRPTSTQTPTSPKPPTQEQLTFPQQKPPAQQEPEASPEPPTPVTATEPKAEPDTPEFLFHKLLNEARRKEGLKELAYDDKLASIAEAHSIDMSPAGRNFYHEGTTGNPHVNPSGLDPDDRATKAGFTGWKRYGENVARFSRSNLKSWTKQQIAQQLFNQWWNSPPHHKNMMSPNYNRHGVGIYVYGNGVWGTDDFALK